MIDELTRPTTTAPWSHERIPAGFDAQRVYEHAIAVGGDRRRRRRRKYAAALAVLTMIVALFVVHDFSPTPPARVGPVAPEPEATADIATLAALKAQRPTPSALRREILAVGDSVMLGAATSLETDIPGFYVDAKISRQVGDTASVLGQYARAGVLPRRVVIGVATNGTFTDAQFQAVMRALGNRQVIFLNALMPRPWESEVNRQLASNVKKYANARLIDWHRAGSAHPGWFVSDGTHLNPSGVRGYEHLIQVTIAR